jgi:raffinose/stachyose/melibiose transport system substrate-binding protein
MGVLAISLTACSSGSTASSTPENFTFLAINENTTVPAVLTSLSENECKAENTALPLKINKQAQGTLDQQLQLLAGQDALPVAFTSANSADLTKKLATAGDIVDFTSETTVASQIAPAAASAVNALYDDKLLVLPTELNIEGIWYNKQILSDNNVEVPTTWEELVSAFGTLDDAGVQPITDAGKAGDGWGVTRWVGAYLYRTIGADALTKVASGDASLTDPEYVAAADAIADLGEKGYFGKSPTSVDYATALNTFLTGGAAFYYQGSWAVTNFNNPDENQIGEDNIGFMPFPSVEGGAGSANDTPANVGVDISVSATAYKDTKVKAWVDCIAANYGTVALRDNTQITGFNADDSIEVPALTQLVQEQIAATTTSVQWFEALFPTGATTASQTNGGLLGSGQLSGKDFMSTVAASLNG